MDLTYHLRMRAGINGDTDICWKAADRIEADAKMIAALRGGLQEVLVIAEIGAPPINMSKAAKWQPIETAPKDESWILLYCDRAGEPAVCAGFWSPDGDWYDSEAASHSIGDLMGSPTHWMPLPETPRLNKSQS